MNVNELLDAVFKLVIIGLILGVALLCAALVVVVAYAPVA